jgi:hypothetical protein
MTLHVFVGYDIREHAAWLVCRDSLLYSAVNHAIIDIEVHPLSVRDLRRRALFDREWTTEYNGVTRDADDGMPFSTEFSFTRFLVPTLAREMGIKGPVVYVDCDFMFLRPITEMLHSLDRTKVLSVVKHAADTISPGVKMDGQFQCAYRRKLWSSLMVFHMGHRRADSLYDQTQVNSTNGRDLHGFSRFQDNEIGEIDPSWNWIPGLSLEGIIPNAVHWSLGGPWMPGYEGTPFADTWRQRYQSVMSRLIAGRDLAETFSLV